MLDLAIRNGLVVDGTSAAPIEADVGIEKDRIVEIGRVGPARQVLNADGLVVSPGFVDAHTHDDMQLCRDPHNRDKLLRDLSQIPNAARTWDAFEHCDQTCSEPRQQQRPDVTTRRAHSPTPGIKASPLRAFRIFGDRGASWTDPPLVLSRPIRPENAIRVPLQTPDGHFLTKPSPASALKTIFSPNGRRRLPPFGPKMHFLGDVPPKSQGRPESP